MINQTIQQGYLVVVFEKDEYTSRKMIVNDTRKYGCSPKNHTIISLPS
jgi:hypothetical protein